MSSFDQVSSAGLEDECPALLQTYMELKWK